VERIAMEKRKDCAYCGSSADEREHAVPRALYPSSLAQSRVQRIVVPTCKACNKSWQDDEPHFRTMLLLCGNSNPVVNELWDGPARRSFDQVDGHRRLRDLYAQMVAVSTPEGERHKVYPDRDPRFMRVVRKIVRGLCYHHKMDALPILDEQVWAGVLRHDVPPDCLAAMTHADADVLQYFYERSDDPDIHSTWLLNFYERASFISLVYRSVEGHERVNSTAA
jgi:hypothetical protein